MNSTSNDEEPLLYQAALHESTTQEGVDDALRSLLSAPRVTKDGDMVLIEVPQPLLMDFLRHRVRALGFISDGSFSGSVARVPLPAIGALVADLIPAERRKSVESILRAHGVPGTGLSDLVSGSLSQFGRKVAGAAGAKAGERIGSKLGDYFSEHLDGVFDWVGEHLFSKIPVILSPRGEFSDGALKLKQVKKQLFLAAAKIVGLYDGLTWQASSDLERDAILNNLDYVKKDCIHVAINLAPVEEWAISQHIPRKEGDPLRVCFLSRISPMKNLDFALQALNGVRASIILTICGPKEDPAYWSNCEHLIAQLPKNVSVAYGGTVQPDDVKQTMAQHDLFLLPTRGENYGHVIHEALCAGLPVLISDQTPWNEVTERGVGWALPLDSPSEFARIIDEVASWVPERYARIRPLAVEFAREKSVDNDVLEANRNLFSAAISRGRS